MKTIFVDGLQCATPSREYFEEAKNAGLDLIQITLVFWENMSETMKIIGDWFRIFDDFSDLIYPATDLHGLKEEIGNGKIGVIFGFQNCSSIENNIDTLEIYRRLNVGVMQLSYNNQSPLCGGCYEKEEVGLSRFGKRVIAEMNRVGMIVDMSHSCTKATLEAIACSQRAIVITHAQSLTFRKSIRNKPDYVLKELAASGGIMGLSFYPFHLKNTSQCSIEEMIDEIKRLIDLLGIEHLAIGSDICTGKSVLDLEYMRNGRWTKIKDYGEGSAKQSGWPASTNWFQRISDFGKLKKHFLKHGLSEEQTKKILGENWLKFFQNSLSSNS